AHAPRPPGAPGACPHHPEAGKYRGAAEGIEAPRTFPEAGIAVDRHLVATQAAVEPGGPLVIPPDVPGSLGGKNLIAAHHGTGEGAEIGQPAAVDIAIGVEPGGVDQVQVECLSVPAQADGVGRGLEKLLVATGEKAVPILGKEVVDKQQIANSPGENLPPGLDIQGAAQ